MISVTICINNRPIVHRSAVNVRRNKHAKLGQAICDYEVDDGRVLVHDRDEGAVALAIRMLEGVHEVKEGYPLGG